MLATTSSGLNNQSQAGGSYNSERTDSNIVEYGETSTSFFSTDYKKHDDLKQMLDSNKDSLKLEAMKRIIGMVAKGKEATDLFPAVVKNVVSKNIEVKKLVYVYLVRYAEEQQDLALLSISTFQRALKDPNQLIRASALRVLSSIRVPMIVPIVMLAIRESASDMSPYVRKTVAHAIPKLYHLDPEQKDELITVIEKLLGDRTTLVVGSAVMAFDEVCPERTDLIHKNYRKLCNLLIDVDEWGQVLIINMLTRYARTQFTDPNLDDIQEEEEKAFYESSSDEADDALNGMKEPKKVPAVLDPDHRLLLRQAKPLLQSRNAAVVMAVAQLYHHTAPKNEVAIVAKALIRLLRGHKEVQSVVLKCIASMSVQRKGIFEPFLKSFFVRTSDATHIKLLKLEILTNLATEASISIILREFQTYISSTDKESVAATIQAIGRCASSITEVTETCLNGLVHLLSNRDEYVVAESVVVIKKLLQTQENEHNDILKQMAKLLDFITVPAARAAILWLIGEYNNRVPKIAPDVLRKAAKTFADEQNIVKLQILNLAVKLYAYNSTQIQLLCQYIFNLARYDQNYDIRCRARLLKQFIFPSNENSVLSQKMKEIFLAVKPAPALESKYKGREQFQLGSMSHYLSQRVTGYQDLPKFPETAPDNSVRNVEPPPQEVARREAETSKHASKPAKTSKGAVPKNKSRSFYSEEEKSSSSEDEDSSEDSSSDSGSESESESGDEKVGNGKESSSEDESDDDSSESEDESSDESSETASSDSSDESVNQKSNGKATNVKTVEKKPPPPNKSNLDLLLDLEDFAPVGAPLMTPSLGGFLSPMTPATNLGDSIELIGPSYIPNTYAELLNKINGFGLSVTYRYTRGPHLFSAYMVSIELLFTNHGSLTLRDIKCGKTTLPSGVILNEFAPIDVLEPKSSLTRVLGIDFNDSTQSLSFEIVSDAGTSKVNISATVGAFLRAVAMSEKTFNAEKQKLRGMTEHTSKLPVTLEAPLLRQKIFEIANVGGITTEDPKFLLFAGHTMNSRSLVLITIQFLEGDEVEVTVNCEKMVIGSILLNEIKAALKA
ncbi:AP-3 complex subunit beta-2 [Culicoides brevitarsis]|uniref:AP-3 complex subunit beta-2 n=1 Tax=Culicoides brevitarsis TaxID=469753 RepID=UPI00307BE9E3